MNVLNIPIRNSPQSTWSKANFGDLWTRKAKNGRGHMNYILVLGKKKLLQGLSKNHEDTETPSPKNKCQKKGFLTFLVMVIVLLLSV